ncbi:hypothetical protein FYK55_24175 [Roseiconus nitratireducens]|uniref:Transmembrane protein (PGPGW) n=1 Tax=Roseiconus nitratireducens TaxID=2605748 RepID=A0A5M6D2R6_9BACT|nr:PGPGW domain-containing protein [Roseiconus nitratireducens]KAA5539435.1 hypothetical protein FYK55_24175 [Roseiconus nitratireducens]
MTVTNGPDRMIWQEMNETLLWWLVAASVATFVITLLAIPAIIVRLPAEYFCHRRRHPDPPQGAAAVLYYGWLIAKNVAGVVMILLGIAMLVLPGQGILSILIGMSLTNFPGKYRLERFLVSRPPVYRSINWIRARAGRSPIKAPDLS